MQMRKSVEQGDLEILHSYRQKSLPGKAQNEEHSSLPIVAYSHCVHNMMEGTGFRYSSNFSLLKFDGMHMLSQGAHGH